ncbi:MAG: FAD binding domain-containing protein [Desulfobacterales bacterium]|nr:FAD binding domain-containing protein [Desulfobacterales bacterium]
MSIEQYLIPESIDECLALLNRFRGRVMLIAGGTDLMPKLAQKKLKPTVLVDVTGIENFCDLFETQTDLVVGAGTTHAQVAGNETLSQTWPALTRACGSIGSPQIRNIATLTGNIVTAMPGADAAVALVALDASVEIASPEGKRSAAVEDLYAGVGQSKIDSSREIITAIKIPRPQKKHGNAYGRISPRNSFCFPIVNAAAALTCENETIISARLAIGPVADRPFRPQQAEVVLRGAALGDLKAIDEAAILASREANPRSSCLRGCADYRRELLKVLVKQVIMDASERLAC